MRKLFKVAAIVALVAVMVPVFAQGKDYGPIVDKVIFDVRMDQTIGVKDTVAGKTDLFAWGLGGDTFFDLPQADRDKLWIYAVPSGSWSYCMNPIPNKAPYVWKTESGEEFFNPLAIREIRFALNWLMNRKKIVDEILRGAGEPAFTAMTPGQPGTYKYNVIAAKMGMTATGDEKRAIADITAAMEKAAQLPENQGKLVKSGQFWTYNGKPVVVKLIIRVDDPKGRLPAGRYMADQIEKAGIKVERLEYDRSKAVKMVYSGDPAKYEWTMYTEGWGAGATRAWWDISISQMYAPWYGYMAGGATEGYWNYENKELDELSQKSINGQFLTEKEYWDMNLKAMEIGLKEAVRIWVCTQNQYYVANKNRVVNRFAYGLGDGLNEWSYITADVKPEKDGTKILRATQFSARGSLFMSAWDPIGTDGVTDTYSRAIADNVRMLSSFEAPNSALDTPYLFTWDPKSVKTQIARNAKGDIEGQIVVPANAVKYDSKTKTWKDVGPNAQKAFSTGTYRFAGKAKWHNGRDVSAIDVMYAMAFVKDWATKDSEDDLLYEEAYSSQVTPGLETFRGIVFNKDGTFTTYFDYNWPMDPNRVTASGTPGLSVGPMPLPWDVYEALALLVTEGAASGTVYSISPDPSMTEIDIINPTCVADIKAKLNEMISKKYIPASLKGKITADDAAKAYKASLDFINKYGHAFISNGPFMITKIDTKANFVELSANRNWIFKKDYWPKVFATTITNIDQVIVPATAGRNADVTVTAKVSTFVYPSDKMNPAGNNVKISLTLITPAGEKVFTGKMTKAGEFAVVIPAKELAALKAGAYTIVVETKIANEAPSVKVDTLNLN
ncbi:MAG TPA: ABC transporter substrate-binding protein [Spirochaetales bacterium]|nr:ABC transporter substrate-binding protein [Spirochaetales bacterium]